MRRSRSFAALGVVTLLMGACGRGGGAALQEDVPSRDDLLDQLSSCPEEDRSGDWLPFSHYETVDWWIDVGDVSASESATEVAGGDLTVTGEMYTASGTSSRVARTLPFKPFIAQDFVSALSASGVSVWVGGGDSSGLLSEDTVRLLIVETPDGLAHLGGDCLDAVYGEPIRRRLGDDAWSRTLKGMTGNVGADLAAAMSDATNEGGLQSQSSPDGQPEQIVPGMTDRLPAELQNRVAQLPVANVSLRWPSNWGSYETVLCGRTAVAWGDCVATSAVAPSKDGRRAVLASFYVEPTSPWFELWLLDEAADLSEPSQRLIRFAVDRGAVDDGHAIEIVLDGVLLTSDSPEIDGLDVSHRVCETKLIQTNGSAPRVLDRC